ncbi:MAG: DctP family TRAP transporter solute-binding subunit [Eubacteriales bacterium]|jgi:tripartite ATP-independent transporter DctP family solute receptor
MKKEFTRKMIACALTLSLAALTITSGCSSTDQNNTDPSSSTSTSSSGENIKLRLGHIQPVEHLNHIATTYMSDLVKERTNGSVIIEIYPAETLGVEKEMADAISIGGLDMFCCSASQFTLKYEPMSIFEGPYIFRDREHVKKVYESEIMDELNEGLAKTCNVRSIAQLYYGTRHTTTSTVAAKTPADFNGVKLRAPNTPIFMDTVNAMGAVATPLAYAETYLALQQGVVDGQENPASAIASMKFDEVQKYLILTAHMIQINHIFLGELTRQQLSDEVVDIIETAATEATEKYNDEAYKIEDDLLAQLGETMTIVEPDLDAFREACSSVYEKYEDAWGEGMVERIQAIQ